MRIYSEMANSQRLLNYQINRKDNSDITSVTNYSEQTERLIPLVPRDIPDDDISSKTGKPEANHNICEDDKLSYSAMDEEFVKDKEINLFDMQEFSTLEEDY